MNFIYTILLFVFLSTISFVIGSQLPDGELLVVLTVFGFTALTATTITILAAVFQNMTFRNYVNSYCNRIKENKRDLKSVKDEMTEYKDEIADSLTKLYPKYEKEMFKNMNPSDAEHISALLIKYPELKFNGVLEKHTARLSSYITECHEKKRDINGYLRRIENIETCGWVIGSIKKPAFVEKLINEEFES